MEIGKFLCEQDIVIGMRVNGKRSALSRIATRLGERVGKSQGAVLAALLQRERLGSTAIGHGVAIPHGRLDGISAPAPVLATLQRPVSFGASDSEPVDLLLALLWPKSDSPGFVPTLAGFWRLFRKAELRDRLRGSETAAEARGWIEHFDGGSGVRRRRHCLPFERAPMAGLLQESMP